VSSLGHRETTGQALLDAVRGPWNAIEKGYTTLAASVLAKIDCASHNRRPRASWRLFATSSSASTIWSRSARTQPPPRCQPGSANSRLRRRCASSSKRANLPQPTYFAYRSANRIDDYTAPVPNEHAAPKLPPTLSASVRCTSLEPSTFRSRRTSHGSASGR
jgi:hypothetical protein